MMGNFHCQLCYLSITMEMNTWVCPRDYSQKSVVEEGRPTLDMGGTSL